MKKVLFTATVDRHILSFHIPYIKWFKEQGYEVHVACNGEAKIPFAHKKHNIPFQRSPYSSNNIKAYIELKRILEENDFSLIHCNTPMGGVVTRLAAIKARKKGTKVIYTAHGFHFFSKAPFFNWILYYPIEKWLSKYTDCLITINEEDYKRCIHNNFKAKSINIINGIGVDLNKFQPATPEKKSQLRKEYGYSADDFILVYPAELNYNKHQDLLIDAVNILKDRVPNIKLLLAGVGELKTQYEDQVTTLGLEKNIKLLGYRTDMANLLKISDLAVSASRREGLPVNVMEAMATGLPIVLTNCRGNRDLVSEGENGYIVELEDAKGLADKIQKLYKSETIRIEFGSRSLELVGKYSIKNVLCEMQKIYSSYLK